jgi:hypothetical protein
MNHFEICHSTGYLQQVAKLLGEEFNPDSLVNRDEFIKNERVAEFATNLAKVHNLRVAASTVEHLRAALRLGHEDGKVYKVDPAQKSTSLPIAESFVKFIEFSERIPFSLYGETHYYNGVYVDHTRTSFFNKDKQDLCLSLIAVSQSHMKERSRDDIVNILIPVLDSADESIKVAVEKNAEYMKAVTGVEYSEVDRQSVEAFIRTIISAMGVISENEFVKVKANPPVEIYERLNATKNKKKQRRLIRALMNESLFDKWEIKNA